jgi:hypothetical protein
MKRDPEETDFDGAGAADMTSFFTAMACKVLLSLW